MSILTALLLLLSTAAPTHEYHVSKTNLRYVAERQQLQVEMHLFVEDLERDMVAHGARENLELGTELELDNAADDLMDYLRKRFEVTWGDEAVPFELIGYELEDDLHGFWVYLAAENIAPATKVSVSNNLLTETYPDQKNIVKIFTGEVRGATLLMSKQRTRGAVEL